MHPPRAEGFELIAVCLICPRTWYGVFILEVFREIGRAPGVLSTRLRDRCIASQQTCSSSKSTLLQPCLVSDCFISGTQLL